MNMELDGIFRFYDSRRPLRYEVLDNSRGPSDFRQTVIADWGDVRRAVKTVSNAFTTPRRVELWRRVIGAYRSMGCYCPRILPNRYGRYAETMEYKGLPCVTFAEEASIYPAAERFEQERIWKDGRRVYQEDVLRLTAQVGAQRWDFVDFPSAYCIFEPFDPSESGDEVMECALWVKERIERDFPEQGGRFHRIWRAFLENKAGLFRVYRQLPTSVFQADMGEGNVLLDGELRLAGVLDFNLSGRETVLNMLFREALVNFEEDMLRDRQLQEKAFSMFVENLGVIRRYYSFSPAEIEAAPLLYRYLRPFWWYTVRALEGSRGDPAGIGRVLTWMETEQARRIDFQALMR